MPESADPISSRRVLVTGATGYVGGRLVPRLLDDGDEVVCLVRNPASLDRPFTPAVTTVEGSADDPDAVAEAARGCSVAYYLIHSLDGDDFEQRDRDLAEAFRTGCERAGVERIVYLGGLGAEDDDLSPHLRSRQEVGAVLAAGPIAVTELRAAVIIGSGSASFEMLRWLTELLPIMTTPSWVNSTKCQPTGINDVLEALCAARHRTVAGHDVLELGGPDVVTYREMMDIYAEAAGLPRRRIIGLPTLSPGLSAHWVALVTPLPATLARQLVDSLVNDVVVTGESAADALGLDVQSFESAVREAIRMVDDLVIPTRWSGNSRAELDATPDADDPDWAGGKVFEDVRRVVTPATSPQSVYGVVTSLGGERGWLWGSWLWWVRGALDQLAGGIGLRRGRRHPYELAVGDAVDFWRVVDLEPDRFLRLRAEMKLPGYAWLEWTISPTTDASGQHATEVVQRARYVPRGLLGRLYWYSVVPFHHVIFPKMIGAILRAAEAETIAGTDAEAVTT
ncbi:MAG: SDR family oxidoreductase [Acidimicrobiales bacterium]|nr:SDR family oxidoreductase [Acidimicrobiales bacterium]